MNIEKVRTFIISNQKLLLLILGYFFIRLLFLTRLPIFNDEAIYLDWGWRETHAPGFLFYSLYDAKQPLLMWIFGLFETIFPDPLFAGRFVSVLAGCITLLGVYKIGKKLFSEQVGIISGILYTIIPIFSFYDRQALMESAIGAAGVWSVYQSIKFFGRPTRKNALILGIILGIGFFIKSSMLFFVFAFLAITFLLIIRNFQRKKILGSLWIVVVGSLGTDFFLLINPQFWATYGSNSRYALTLSEMFHFPFSIWSANFTSIIEIIFIYLTPLIVILACYWAYLLFQKKSREQHIFLLFLAIPLILETFVARGTQQRYLVSYLPLFTVLAAFSLQKLVSKFSQFIILIFILIFIVPLSITLLEIINPVAYFSQLSKITPLSEQYDYVIGMISGFGIPETINKINQLSDGPTVVGIALNTGNPESAIQIAYEKSDTVKVIYFDTQVVSPTIISHYDCMQSSTPLYFVAREQQQGGMNKYLEKVTEIPKPYNPGSVIGIYTLKKQCKGTTLHVDFSKS